MYQLKKWRKYIIAYTLVISIVLTPGLNCKIFAETPTQYPNFWAITELVEAEALGLLVEDWQSTLHNSVTKEQFASILEEVNAKMKILGLRESQTKVQVKEVAELTKGDVLSALYAEIANYELPADLLDKNMSGIEYMREKGIVKGDGKGSYNEESLCTVEEALLLSQRTISNLYEELGKSSKGLLWKASNEKNTVYLLGTIHVDRGNVYPFSDNLKNALAESQEAIFEVDFLDQEGIEYFMLKQTYTDGATLKDHIPKELYEELIPIMNSIGLTEESFATYKPWALANTLSSLAMSKESTDSKKSVMVIDNYMYSKALVTGKTISEIEGYQYQADLFDSLSQAYQIEYLKQNLAVYKNIEVGNEKTEDFTQLDQWIKAWKERDVETFEKSVDKDSEAASKDELSQKLYGERDENMTAYVIKCLQTEGENTYIVVVGAGHMVGEKGIVQSVKDAGYKVEVVE